jgi:hypothetical protein
MVRLTGAINGRKYSCTYSDLRQRFIPMAVLEAVQDNAPLSGSHLVELARGFQPTRPFDSEVNER